MAPSKRTRGRYVKLVGYFIAAVAGGITLLVASRWVAPEPEPEPGQAVTSTAPATAPAVPTDPTPKPSSENAGAQNLSGLLLLLSMGLFVLALICAGWIFWEVRRSRPAWKTQTKYPRRR